MFPEAASLGRLPFRSPCISGPKDGNADLLETRSLPRKRISLRPGWEDAVLPESATVAASPSAIGAHIEGRHTSSVKGRQYVVLAASRLNSAIAAVSSHGQLYANPRGCIPIKLYSQKQEMGQIRPTGCHLPTLALSQLSSCLCSGRLSPTSSHAGCAA